MQTQLDKALKLAKKTGDRLIVFDSPTSENAFVVMNLEQYEDLLDGECDGNCNFEHEDDTEFDEDFDFEEEMGLNEDFGSDLAGLTEEEMLDKINRDIAQWKEVNSDHGNEQNLGENEEKVAEYTPANESNQEEQEMSRSFGESQDRRSRWAIRNDVKEAAEEIIEEDRHYLEEVNF